MSLQFVHVLQSSTVQPLQEQLRLVPCLHTVHNPLILFLTGWSHITCSMTSVKTNRCNCTWLHVNRSKSTCLLTKHSTFNCDYEHMYKMYTREELFTTFKSFLVPWMYIGGQTFFAACWNNVAQIGILFCLSWQFRTAKDAFKWLQNILELPCVKKNSIIIYIWRIYISTDIKHSLHSR